MSSMRLRLFLTGALFLAPTLAFAADGGFTVVAESSQGTIPRGAQRVPVLTLYVDTPCTGTPAISEIAVRHQGQGDIADIDQLYAFMNGERVGKTGAKVRRDGVARISLQGIQVPACVKGVQIQIVADFVQNSSVYGEHRFVIPDSSSIAASAPVTLMQQKTAAVIRSVGQETGTVVVEFLPLTETVSYGDRRTVARLRLSVSGNRDQGISAITFTNQGSATNADLQNLYVANTRGEALTLSAPALMNDHVQLVFVKPLSLRRSEVRLLNLVADVKASRRRTIRFSVEQPVDVQAYPAR